MKAKSIITGILLLFVFVSVAYLVIQESRQQADKAGGPDEVKGLQSSDTIPSEKAGSPNSGKEVGHRVIAYYFHGHVRCQTCRKIEAYSREALESAFADELGSGKLEWHAINVEEAENEHFVEDYKLSTKSLVLVDVREGQQKGWKNLKRVWDLVGDKQSFFSYVREETQAFMEADD